MAGGAPRRGELYSAVAVDSESRRLQFRCRQKVWFGERTHAKVFALFASESERPRLRAQISTKHHQHLNLITGTSILSGGNQKFVDETSLFISEINNKAKVP